MTTLTDTAASTSELELRLMEAIDACNASAKRESQSAHRYANANRKSKFMGAIAVTSVTGSLALFTLNPVGAQGGYGPTLASLQAQVNTLLSRTQFITANATTKTMKVTGCNVLIQSGSGSTDDNGTLSGLGNLTIGYNTGQTVGHQTGSHNLILGEYEDYTSFGGLVAGTCNTISGPRATVIGGAFNVASGDCASILGGAYNTSSSNDCSTVAGGTGNTASGTYSTVSGGNSCAATSSASSVSGGTSNIASGVASIVCGGYGNVASAAYSTVLAGNFNLASGQSSSVAGGSQNVASGAQSAILGGLYNNAGGSFSIICGGAYCYTGGGHIPSDSEAILGGYGTSNTTQYGHTP